MPDVYLGLGSNVMPEDNLRLAVSELADRFVLKSVSPVYRNAPVGFDGDDFLNAVVLVETDMPALAVCGELEQIHDLAGRKRGTDSFVSRTLDIDLLLYGSDIVDESPVRVPRDDILRYSFVLRPLADIAPDLRHPVTQRTMAEHWAAFDAAGHRLVDDSLDLRLPAD